MMTRTLAPALLPPGRRIYAIGDVHGCDAQLAALHRAIAGDIAARPVASALVVHLGDYIDRGPDSAGVVARLAGGLGAPAESVSLMGNHEAMMLQALGLTGALEGRPPHPEDVTLWLANGGIAALESWGVCNLTDPAVWRQAVPAGHLAWLLERPLMHQEGGYLFVHAGIRPGLPLAQQQARDLLWIREPFLSSPEPHPLVVVHGHTPAAAPSVRANRIGIDTGAVMGGMLTCLVLEDDSMAFLEA